MWHWHSPPHFLLLFMFPSTWGKGYAFRTLNGCWYCRFHWSNKMILMKIWHYQYPASTEKTQLICLATTTIRYWYTLTGEISKPGWTALKGDLSSWQVPSRGRSDGREKSLSDTGGVDSSRREGTVVGDVGFNQQHLELPPLLPNLTNHLCSGMWVAAPISVMSYSHTLHWCRHSSLTQP